MQHHAGQGAARPLAPVRPTHGRRAPAPMGLQAQPQPVVAALEAVIGHQLLVEVLGREVPVLEQLQHPRHLVHRRAPRRDPAQAAVVETVGSLRLVAVAPAPEGALRDTQNLRRLRLAQATPMGAPAKLNGAQGGMVTDTCVRPALTARTSRRRPTDLLWPADWRSRQRLLLAMSATNDVSAKTALAGGIPDYLAPKRLLHPQLRASKRCGSDARCLPRVDITHQPAWRVLHYLRPN